MASTYLQRSISSAGSETKGTFSAWVKRAGLGSFQKLYCSRQADNEFFMIQFRSDEAIQVQLQIGGSNYLDLRTTALYKDTNAWYHIVLVIDSTDSTQADRCKLYVNGERITSFSQNTNSMSADLNCRINGTAQTPRIGSFSGSGDYFDGCMSHVHWVDGTAYQASTFGSTDSTTGEWKINTTPTVTYGTNGFFILKDGNSVTDQSGQSNNLTVGGGTLTDLQDNPSNNFCTWNPIKKVNTIALSNTATTASGNADDGVWGTIGDNQGKWYWETQNNENNTVVGIASEDVTQETGRSQNTGVYGLQNGTTYAYYRNNGSSGQSSGFPQTTTSNTVCHALDLDNGKYFMGVDGVFKDLSGTTSNLSTGADPTFTGLDTTKFWFPFTECRGTGAGCDVNFGNGYFGTTAISSEGTNASGIGKFEYDVPAGYTALSTKGLNE